jgi:hypothetical protein
VADGNRNYRITVQRDRSGPFFDSPWHWEAHTTEAPLWIETGSALFRWSAKWGARRAARKHRRHEYERVESSLSLP